MVVPHDNRSPHRNQRWVECLNSSGETIPPFGVCEVIEASKPDATGRTMIHLRKPYRDGLSNVMINGHLPIANGDTGYCTDDFPAYALYDDGGSPSSGHMWGTIKDSFRIGQGRQGFFILGDASASDTTVRVASMDKLHRVQFVGTLLPGQNASAYLMRWTGGSWELTGTIITVRDPFYRAFALANERAWVEWYGDSYQVACEFGLRRKGKAMAEIKPGNTGNVMLWHDPTGTTCEGAPTSQAVIACHDKVSPSAIVADESVFVHYHTEYRRWMIIPIKSQALIRFKMTTKLPLGGKGKAIEIKTGAAYETVGVEFPIKDPWGDPGMWREDVDDAEYHYKGWCLIPSNPELDNGVPIREIVWMEQIARSINFTIRPSSEMSGGQAKVFVDKYYMQGKDPERSDLNSVSGIIVHDPQNLFGYAKKNAKGMARYNDRNHRYEVVACDQQCPMQVGVLVGRLCPADAGGVVTSAHVMWYPPYGQDADPPIIGTVSNPLSLAGKSGDTVICTWADGKWIILQVQHHPVSVSAGMVSYEAGPPCRLKQPYKTAAVMYCAEGDAYLNLSTHYFITSISRTDNTGSGSIPGGDCKLVYFYGGVCGFGDVVVSGSATDILTFTAQTVLVDVYESGNYIKGDLVTIYTPCLDGPWTENLIQLVDCPTGSS